jgi:CBS-domain-containing membrane protein
MKTNEYGLPGDLTDQDIQEAMSGIEGFLDITMEDFRDIYHHAYVHAHNRLLKKDGMAQEMKVPEQSPRSKGLAGYFLKMKGNSKSPVGVGPMEILWSWIGGFLGIAAVAVLNYKVLSGIGYLFIIGSFGASAVLIYGAIRSPLAQPRNFVGGHVVSAFVGVTSYMLFPENLWLASAFGVATAIAAMHFSKTLHPPGGATALIAVIGGESIHNLGYLYVLIPTFAGSLVMLVVALLVNNIPNSRKYPEFWI